MNTVSVRPSLPVLIRHWPWWEHWFRAHSGDFPAFPGERGHSVCRTGSFSMRNQRQHLLKTSPGGRSVLLARCLPLKPHAHPPRWTRGRLTLFSRPSITSMPLWLRYSSLRFTRLCRPSILVSLLLWKESRQPSESCVGCEIRQLLGKEVSLVGEFGQLGIPLKTGQHRVMKREKDQHLQSVVLGYNSCVKVEGFYAKNLLFLDVLREGLKIRLVVQMLRSLNILKFFFLSFFQDML